MIYISCAMGTGCRLLGVSLFVYSTQWAHGRCHNAVRISCPDPDKLAATRAARVALPGSMPKMGIVLPFKTRRVGSHGLLVNNARAHAGHPSVAL